MSPSDNSDLRARPGERPYVGSHPALPSKPVRKPSIPKPPRPKGAKRRGKALSLLIWLILLGGLGLGGLVGWYAQDLPDVDQLGATTRRPAITLLAADGEVLSAMGDVYGEPLDLSDLPPHLPGAVLATEDRRFYGHFGIDPVGLARAVVSNLKAGGVQQGGSTITQQLAKLLFLKPERTLKRKVQEALLALWLERKFSKREILTIYLNRVYLGSGTFGVDAATQRYFNKSARALTLYESAMVAGLLKAPSRYNPVNDPELARARTAQVLANMVDAGQLGPDQAEAAKRDAVALSARVRPNIGRYFVDMVMGQLARLPETRGKDLTVTTTLDRHLQAKAEARLKALLDKEGDKLGASQGALVVLSMDGAIKAMAGGRDYDDSQFNRAADALRQPGSSFKTFVYLAALDAGMRITDTIEDAPITMGDWSPDNYTGKFLGQVTLKTALAQSLNAATVRLADHVGLRQVMTAAKRLGIHSEMRRDATLSLGSSEVTPLELAWAYLPLANGGLGVQPYGLVEVAETNGPVLLRRQPPEPQRVVQPASLAGMQEMLAEVILSGTGRAALLPGRPAAGKTGTSQNYRDAWFAGFTSDFAAVVWMGNDDGRPMKKVVGGSLPARLWRDLMETAHAGLPPRPLNGPWSEPSPAQQSQDMSAPAQPSQADDDEDGLWQGILRKLGVGGAR
jgi:penicillin-binding protein 1A